MDTKTDIVDPDKMVLYKRSGSSSVLVSSDKT